MKKLDLVSKPSDLAALVLSCGLYRLDPVRER